MNNEFLGPALPLPLDLARTQLSERVGTARGRETNMKTPDELDGPICLTSADFAETMKSPRKIARVDAAVRQHLEETRRPITQYAVAMEELRLTATESAFKARDVAPDVSAADFADTTSDGGQWGGAARKTAKVHAATMRYLEAHPPAIGTPFVASYLAAMDAVRAAVKS
jgi:hypothetical protein